VMQWHDLWWLWALEHCLAGYGFSIWFTCIQVQDTFLSYDAISSCDWKVWKFISKALLL